MDTTSPAEKPLELAEPALPRKDFPSLLAARYTDVSLVGEGGMGTVYRATDRQLRRVVAIKVLKDYDPELARRFILEARAQAKIQHENVCPVYEASQVGAEPYIVMQYVEGTPLSKAAKAWSVEQCIRILRDVALAVHEAHRLGMIHRDIKPGNILVEGREDGTKKAYVMDFGLAREVEEKGETRTGAIVGTPAYMPPEQARGEVRAMDRRSDVYSLGATLYDILAGHPPFVAEHPWKLLLKVAYEEPPSLSLVKRGIAPDIETIVMKCLEREPSKRYDSARAFADDLRRFLDGDPILAKRASLARVFWKKLKKNKLATAFGVTVLAAALGVTGTWVAAKRRADEQTKLAQALGEDVKEMELFLRGAYGMPLHDVERERDIVRTRLSDIEGRMKSAGEMGEGPGNYALGRGALALGDPERARVYLEKAVASGYSSPELEYALGRAFGELFRRALTETHRLTNPESKKKRVAELEQTLRDPALTHLRAAGLGNLESPLYAEGLIALFEGRYEDALAKAKEAFEKAPWMYEAKRLQADALVALGNKFAHDAAFDFDKMRSFFEPAAEAYSEATEMGRSDPELHRAECEMWEKMGWAAAAKGVSATQAFESAASACERAVAASRADVNARVQEALVLSAWYSVETEDKGNRLNADSMVRSAEQARLMSPGDVMAQYAVARAKLYSGERLVQEGKWADMEPVIEEYNKTTMLDPQFTWAHNELGHAHLIDAETRLFSGRDVKEAVSAAIVCFDRAIALDPTFLLAAQFKVRALGVGLEDEVVRGVSTDGSVHTLAAAVEKLASQLGAADWTVVYWKAKASLLEGRHNLSVGASPVEASDAARAAVSAFTKGGTPDAWLAAKVVEALLLNAQYALQVGKSAAEMVEKAAGIIQEQRKNGDLNEALRRLVAQLAALRFQDPTELQNLRPEDFDVALDALKPTLDKGAQDPAPYQLAAEIWARRAVWLVHKKADATLAITQGLDLVQQALRRNPRMARAFATEALLHHLALSNAQSSTVKQSTNERLQKALAAARRNNPRIRVDSTLREAAALGETSGGISAANDP